MSPTGYNRDVNITHNEFVWIGDSAMAAWGYTAPLGQGAFSLADLTRDVAPTSQRPSDLSLLLRYQSKTLRPIASFTVNVQL
jgi:hypothetical protein